MTRREQRINAEFVQGRPVFAPMGLDPGDDDRWSGAWAFALAGAYLASRRSRAKVRKFASARKKPMTRRNYSPDAAQARNQKPESTLEYEPGPAFGRGGRG